LKQIINRDLNYFVIFRRFISIYVRGTSGSKKTFDDDEVPVGAVVVHKNRIF
jgi:hypothetical protein